MTLWDLAKDRLYENTKKLQAVDEGQTAEEDSAARDDSYILLFGSKNCGKTSLILRFLDKDEQVKPTIALEYTYGRRTKGNNKEVGHIWELAGGASLLNLLEVPINIHSLENLSLILTLDLSKPDEMWTTMEACLKAIRKRLDTIFEKNKELKEKLLLKTWAKIGNEHPDKEFIKPIPIQFAVVGTKYDMFQDMETEKRKIICKTLRFIAHTTGATLQFFSLKNESLVTRGRALMSHFIFNTPSSQSANFLTFFQTGKKELLLFMNLKGIATDPNKPLFVPVGGDSVVDIGAPPISEGEHFPGDTREPMDLWKASFCSVFPQKSAAVELPKDPGQDAQFKEETIRLLRQQKDKELEIYIKQKARENIGDEIKTDD